MPQRVSLVSFGLETFVLAQLPLMNVSFAYRPTCKHTFVFFLNNIHPFNCITSQISICNKIISLTTIYFSEMGEKISLKIEVRTDISFYMGEHLF